MKKRTIYIIKPKKHNNYGLGALVLEVLKYIQYAELMGYIPVVDWREDTQYSDMGNDSEGINAWDIFFKPMNGIEISQINTSEDEIVFSKEEHLNEIDLDDRVKKKFDEYVIALAKNLFKKYFVVSDYVYEELNNVKFDFDKTAGIYLRGTDYTVLEPEKHAIQPEADQAIKMVDYYMKKYQLSYVWCVTEDADMYNRVSDYYGKRLIMIPFDKHISNYEGNCCLSDDQRSLLQLGRTPPF